MGSPRVVPVPWASTVWMSVVVSRALVRAWWMTRSWAGPLGAVRPLLAPSWLMAEPRMMARMGWLLVWASVRRSRRRSPAPSDQAAPLALAEKDLQRPSGARPRWRLNSMKTPGVAMMVTPPARARVHSLLRSAWAARWVATREEEQ